MPVVNRIAELAAEAAAWRRDLHAHPELGFDVHRTADFVARKLREFGVDEIATGIGRTGVVGVIRGRGRASGRVVALRADMDALPIEEAADVPFRSTVPGRMHACGHDGHTAMLLCAARYLAETRNFDGDAVVIFQPAEETGGGGGEMVRDGVMERFGVQEVYGLHNMPGIPVGSFAIRPGAIMAAADSFQITIEGRGGHAAMPHRCLDPVLVAAHVITALQGIVSREVDPLEAAVITVASVKAGETTNVIPQTATLLGTCRTLREDVRDMCERRIGEAVSGICAAFGAQGALDYRRGYPVTVNDPARAAFMADMAAQIAGEARVERNVAPMMGAEDFSFMLNARPGAYIFVGNGEGPMVHHPAYRFDDDAIPHGASLWARLVETAMPLGKAA
ncbi:MAG: amidohydrolase [Salinarimonadaceae bacterium]|nr:MAG: amidohydrolase [Salinarimonadaceae bacterium]